MIETVFALAVGVLVWTLTKNIDAVDTSSQRLTHEQYVEQLHALEEAERSEQYG